MRSLTARDSHGEGEGRGDGGAGDEDVCGGEFGLSQISARDRAKGPTQIRF